MAGVIKGVQKNEEVQTGVNVILPTAYKIKERYCANLNEQVLQSP